MFNFFKKNKVSKKLRYFISKDKINFDYRRTHFFSLIEGAKKRKIKNAIDNLSKCPNDILEHLTEKRLYYVYKKLYELFILQTSSYPHDKKEPYERINTFLKDETGEEISNDSGYDFFNTDKSLDKVMDSLLLTDYEWVKFGNLKEDKINGYTLVSMFENIYSFKMISTKDEWFDFLKCVKNNGGFYREVDYNVEVFISYEKSEFDMFFNRYEFYQSHLGIVKTVYIHGKDQNIAYSPSYLEKIREYQEETGDQYFNEFIAKDNVIKLIKPL